MEKGTKIIISLVAGAAIVGTGIYLYKENKKAEQAALDLLKGAVDTIKTESPKETVETDKNIVEKAKVAYEKVKASGVKIDFNKFLADMKAKDAAKKEAARKEATTSSQLQPTDEVIAVKGVQFTPNKKPLSDAAWNNFKLAIKKVEKANGRKSDIGKIISGESKKMTPAMAKERYQKYVTVPEHYAVIKFMDIYAVKKKESDTLKAMGKQQGDLAVSTFKKLGIGG